MWPALDQMVSARRMWVKGEEELALIMREDVELRGSWNKEDTLLGEPGKEKGEKGKERKEAVLNVPEYCL